MSGATTIAVGMPIGDTRAGWPIFDQFHDTTTDWGSTAVVSLTRRHYATALLLDSLRLAFLPHRAKDRDFGRELATSVEAGSHNV